MKIRPANSLYAQDARMLAAHAEQVRLDPESAHLIELTAKACGVTCDRVMDALERDAERRDAELTTRPGEKFPPVGFLADHPRAELFGDLAGQFERLEQPLNMGWMQARNVSLEELQALSAKCALILRAYMALAPRDRLALLAGVFHAAPIPDKPAETILGQRHDAAATSKPPQ